MKHLLLGMYHTDLQPYSSEPEKDILNLLRSNTVLLMEKGELADYALGHKFIMNSSAEIVIMKDGDTHICPEGEYAHVFFPDAEVTETFYQSNHGSSYSFSKARIITKTGEPCE